MYNRPPLLEEPFPGFIGEVLPINAEAHAFEGAGFVAEILRVAQKGRQTLHRARLTSVGFTEILGS